MSSESEVRPGDAHSVGDWGAGALDGVQIPKTTYLDVGIN